MTIKNQLRLFLIGIIAVPFLCSIFPPIYHYLTRPDKILMDGTNKMLKMSELKMSEKDIDILKEVMKTLPPKVEFMLIADRTEILLTNFAEFENQETITDEQLFHHIKKTSNKYFYQFVAPPLEDQSIDMMLISRVNRDFQKNHIHEKKWDKALFWLILLIVISEAFCIPMTIHISSTITKSITLLEKNTQRIVSGELDVELENKKPRNENEITRLTENLEKMRLDLKYDGERRAKFIMGISHDLRTPVALIKGYSEAITDGVVNDMDEIKKSLGIVETKADQLEFMINDLINYVKLYNADWLQTLEPISLKPLLENFASSSKSTAEVYKRNIVIEIDVDENLMVPMDRNLVNRVLENLFSNALRYTKDGDTISISCMQEKDSVKVCVCDTGIGMAEKDLQRIFDLFYRASNSRREQGLGIGLSVVKTVIDAHGWKIDVESELGKGSSFIITIPLENRL